MLHKLSLKSKLIIALMIPILGLVLFTINDGIQSFQEKNEINKLKFYIDESVLLSNVIHELQKERGLSTGYIGSKGKKFKKSLLQQHNMSDSKIKILMNYINKQNHINKFDEIVHKLLKIKTVRTKILNETILFEPVHNYYTDINGIILSYIEIESLKNDNTKSKSLVAYTNLLRAKEDAGRERAILSNIFATGKISSDLLRKIEVIYSSQRTYLANFRLLLSSQQLKNYNTKMLDSSVPEVSRLREIVFSKMIKNNIISEIRALSGFGGIIHDFKNYEVRGDIQYLYRFLSNYNKIIENINQYKNLKTSTDKEKELLGIISKTFELYYKGLSKVTEAYRTNISVNSLDEVVSVNDKDAISAINILSNSILGIKSTHWYDVSTNRINILKEIESNYTQEIRRNLDLIIKEKNNMILGYLFSIIIIIMIISIISLKIIHDITASSNELQKGLSSFFNYLSDETKDIESIIIKNDDEFSQMGKMINKNVKRSKLYLDEKVKFQIEQSQKKDILIMEQSKMAAMGEMIGNISHQWRQPLSVISTGVTGMEMLKEYGILKDEDFKKTCQLVNENAQYLSRTIEDFRNFITGDRIKKVFSLKDTIHSFLHLIEARFTSNQITIILDLDESIQIDGYENELIQCLMSIVNNSRDALLENNVKEKFIFLSTSLKEDNAIINIQDNAKGIAKDVLPKIFEPYFTTKHQSVGTGLGLHLTYDFIVNGMKGTIAAKNTSYSYIDSEYIGAEFIISLPLKS